MRVLTFALFELLPPARSGNVYQAIEGTPEFLFCSYEKGVPSEAVAHYECDELSDTGPSSQRTGLLNVVVFAPPDDELDELERWYAEEHVAMLMRGAGWLRARCFRVRTLSGRPWSYLAMHDLADQSVLDSPELDAAKSTEWRTRLGVREWFTDGARWTCRPLVTNDPA